ncbi:MAG: hypothetical protein C5B46_04505 [Proteobacteria bacterium]|nr:MAG: hypothetical protein C5B46_04505 [Pseudomonadota bacterium]
MVRALLFGWARANHPSHLHYAWDLECAPSLDFAILETTRQAVALLDLGGIERPHLFEPGCGIGGGVTQVAAMLPAATVTGLSLVERQLEIGRAMANRRKLQNIDLVHGNYLSTPFPDAHFDGIFAIECLVYAPIAEKVALCRELFRILRPGRTFVSFEPSRLRDPRDETERKLIQNVLDGWTMPLPPTAVEFQSAACEAGFELTRCEDATTHVHESARRIAAIARRVLAPLAGIARVPLVGNVVVPLGFQSLRHAQRFLQACLSQVGVFEAGLGAYYVHVFRKPAS